MKDKYKADYYPYDFTTIKIKYPKRKHLMIKELDEIPYLDENKNIIDNIHNERMEQYISNDFIEPDMTVLELGGRYGTVSCVINNKLENPKNHVVFEPDTSVINALKHNRKTHKSKFTIFNGIISKKKFKLLKNGYATIAETINDNDKKEKTSNWSLEYVMNHTKLKFDCLVADCEGCLENFIDENLDYIKDYRLIIYEKDQPDICNYKKIENNLSMYGFKNISKSSFYGILIKK